jgi:acetate kinase
MAAALGGLDALVFTGGAGERASALRADAVGGLRFLGAALDGRANLAADDGRDADIGAPGAAVRTFVVGAREDLEIAAQVRAVLRD